MTEIQIDLVELRKLDLSFPYFSKEEIMKCFDIKDTAYDKYRKMFKEKVKDKHSSNFSTCIFVFSISFLYSSRLVIVSLTSISTPPFFNFEIISVNIID